MTSLAWKLNRLRAMSAAEVFHRLFIWLVQHAERIRIYAGWEPRTRCQVSEKTSLFPNIDGWQTTWSEHFSLNRQKLDEMAAGDIDLFSHESLRLGQPVDWHRDPLTGRNSPLVYGKTLNYRDDAQVGDVKVLWELGRHQHLVALASGYACSGDIRYRNAIADQIDGWIEANPFGIGIHWCSSLESGLRLISWAVVHGLLRLRDRQDGLFSAVSDSERLGQSIYQQAWFVRHHLSRHSSANNHLIGELAGLWVATQVFELGVTGEKWASFAQRELEEQADAQVHPDGVNKEQAIYYHLWVLEYLLFAWLVGERSKRGFSQKFQERILQMSDYLHAVSLDAGGPPQIGDADNGFVTRFESTWPNDPFNDVQHAIAIIFGNRKPRTSRTSQKPFWYPLIAGHIGSSDSATEPTSAAIELPKLFREGGYAILGDERVRVVFDAGPLGYPSIAAHGHADALSFCLSVDEHWLLIDPGTFAYHSQAEWRDYFRGTAAHNTLVLNGQNQSRIGGAFLWLDRAHSEIEEFQIYGDGRQCVRGSHNGYETLGAIHGRAISYNASTGTLTIDDEIRVDDNSTPLQVAVHFHFAPDASVELANLECVASNSRNDSSIMIALAGDCDWKLMSGRTDPILGWYSGGLGEKVPTTTLVGTRTATGTTRITTIIHVQRT